jgi:uncharacterized protein (TIGR03435 family)
MGLSFAWPVVLKWTPLLLLMASAALVSAQTKEFEVASVKVHKDADDGRVGIQITPGGRWRATNVPVRLLLQIAYDLRPGQLNGAPGWVDTERYDIDAKLDSSLGPNPKPDEMRPYLQSLLENRFQLKFHHETKDMQVYVLGVSKSGPKLKESDPAAVGPRIRMGMGEMSCTKVKMEILARELSRPLGRPVIDQTGLKGDYDFELSYAPEGPGGAGAPPPGAGPGGSGSPGPAPGAEGPTIFTAVQEQLGLKLDSKKAPVEMFVVEKIERAEEN